VFFHELYEFIPWYAAEFAARNTKTLQLAAIKATNNGLLTQLADFSCFTSRKNCFVS